MKIAITSDNHWHECPLPSADFFIHCGDMTGDGSLGQTEKFAQRLNASGYEGGVIVPGNHDWVFQRQPDLARRLFDPRFSVLIDEGLLWRGFSFWGSPWTPPFMNWAFMKTEHKLKQVYEGMRYGNPRKNGMPRVLDFLVTHGPPHGILDGSWLGSTALRNARVTRQIKYHVFGHIHESGGKQDDRWDAKSFNVSACDLNYELVNEPLILELEE